MAAAGVQKLHLVMGQRSTDDRRALGIQPSLLMGLQTTRPLANSDNLVPDLCEQATDEHPAQAPSHLAAELPHGFSARCQRCDITRL